MNVLIPLVIALLIAGNALYVAAEFAAVSVRKSRVRQLAEEGDRLARLMLPVINERSELDRYVAACQIGITLTSLVLGAYGQATIPPLVRPLLEEAAGMGQVAALSAASVGVLIVLTGFQVVLGELVPKSLALQFPVRVALLTAVPLRWSLWLFQPFIWLLNGSGLAILKLLRTGKPSHGHVHSPDEIEMLLVQGEQGGQLSLTERSRLRRALYLGSRPAHEVMVPRRYVEAVEADQALEAIVATAAESPYTRLPVYRDSLDNVIGILHSKDLVAIDPASEEPGALDDVIRKPMFAPEAVSIDRLLTTMRTERAQLAILLDEYGGMAGLVTLEDVLAELFGEIGDEFKEGQPAPELLPGGLVRLPGLLPLDQARLYTGSAWPGSSDTVGGHVMDVLGHVPSAGERVTIEGSDVVVERVDHNAVYSVLVRRSTERQHASG